MRPAKLNAPKVHSSPLPATQPQIPFGLSQVKQCSIFFPWGLRACAHLSLLLAPPPLRPPHHLVPLLPPLPPPHGTACDYNRCRYDFDDTNRTQIVLDSKWGWKSPRSIYYLPYYKAILGDNFRFVHVVRDGRDVAVGDNQMQYNGLCRYVRGPDGAENSCGSLQQRRDVDVAAPRSHKKSFDPKARVHFWAQMNTEAFKYGVTVLGPKRYFLLRIEDMALQDPKPLLNRLAAFLNVPNITTERMQALVKMNDGHQKSYGGNKYDKQTRMQYLAQIGNEGREALDLFGYKLDDWGLAKAAPRVDQLVKV